MQGVVKEAPPASSEQNSDDGPPGLFDMMKMPYVGMWLLVTAYMWFGTAFG